MKLMTLNGRSDKVKNFRSKRREDRFIQRVLEIEALETRLLLSGVGTGLHKKKVTFTDSDGDKVTVKLTGPSGAYFDIMLTGAATTGADIESILIHGGTASSALSITDTPVKFHGPVVGVSPSLYSNAITNVGIIDAVSTTALRGIALSGAIVADIDLPGVAVGSIGLNPGKAPIIDRIMTTVTGSFPTYAVQTPFVDFHTITVGSVTGSISLTGQVGEDFLGAITATTGGIHSIVGLNALLTSTVSAAGNIDNIQVLGAGGADISTTAAGNLTLNIGNGGITVPASVTVGGHLNISVSGGGIVGGTVLTAGNGISGGDPTSTTDTIQIAGAVGAATFHATGGNIANMTVTGTGGLTGTQIIADTGTIGILTADHFSGVFVNSVLGSIAGISAHTATATAAIGTSSFHAGTTIGPITAQNDKLNGIGISASSFRADDVGDAALTGGFGAITAAVTGGPGAIGISNSAFSTAGSFSGAITVTAGAAGGAMGVGDAIVGTTAGATIFSALGSFLGPINITGNIDGTAPTGAANAGVSFLAGYDIGANQVINGPVPPTDDVLGASTASPHITSMTVTGNVNGLTLAAGISPTDAIFGGLAGTADTLNAPLSSLGTYSVTGSTKNSLFESGTTLTLSDLHQVFSNNTVIAFTGDVGDISLNGSFANTTPFAGNTITALQGSIGNVLIHNSSPIGTDAIGAGNTLNAHTGIGDIVGITDGTGTGINTLTATGNKAYNLVAGTGSVGSIIGVATNATGTSGITSLTAAGINVGTAVSAAATTFLGANLSTADNTAVTALLGTGGVVGYTNGTGFGIDPATITATTSVGNVAGVVNSTLGQNGLDSVTVTAGTTIGDITGTTIADGVGHTTTVGILSSHFTAGATGTGTIGNVVGSATSSVAAIDHYGINSSDFNAGGGVVGTGHIGNVTATGTANGATAAINAYGIKATTIQAGYGEGGIGTIGNVTGAGTAATTVGAAVAHGISTTTVIHAGADAAATNGTGTIGNVSGTATASSINPGAGANATAIGITTNSILAGKGTGSGAVGNISGTATATVSSFTGQTALAQGINALTVTTAGTAATDSIGTVTGAATASSTAASTGTATATAEAIKGSAFTAGSAGSGTIGAITVGATATAVAPLGSATATAQGIDPTTFAAGGTATGSTGGIGTITAGTALAPITATATSGTNANATAEGISSGTFQADAGGPTGTIGAITAATSANATSNGVASGATAVTSEGILNSTFTAGTITGAATPGTGTIADAGITVSASGVAIANADTATATVLGLDTNTITAGGAQTGTNGGGVGKIATVGGISVTDFGSATSTLAAAAATATGISAGTYSANGLTGTIGAITIAGSGTAETVSGLAAYATTAGVNVNATAKGYGITGATFNAANGGDVGTGIATGTIGAVTDTVKVIATNSQTSNVAGTGKADAEAYGIASVTSFIAGSNAAGGTGTIGASGSTVIASATANDVTPTGAVATTSIAYGFDNSGNVIKAGYNASGGTLGTGTIGSITATGTAVTNVAAAATTTISKAVGISGTIRAGSTGNHGAGTIGNISGTAMATDNATAVAIALDNYACGIGTATIQSGDMDGTGAGAGMVGTVTGAATTSALANSGALGISGVSVLAGTSIGNVTGTSAGATTIANAIGINSSVFQADGGTTGLLGTIGNITASTAGGTALTAYAINGALFSSIQGIGTITVTGGGVTGSQFVAGTSYGAVGADHAGRHNATSAATIGNVSIAGILTSSDLIAGVDSGNNVFGDVAGTDVLLLAANGTIGTVTIGAGGTAAAAVNAAANRTTAIEAHTIGLVTVGGNGAVTVVTGGDDWQVDTNISNTLTAADARVRTL